MFGFIKKLFGGIFAFLGGLFGGNKSQDEASAPKTKKSQGYFLELDDTGSVKSTEEVKKPEPVKAEAPAPAAQNQPEKAAVATLERPKAEPKEETKPVVAAKDVSAENGKVKIEAQPNPPATAASNGKVEAQNDMTFAPKYLMPSASSSRRRPGPSMDMFRDMARQVKPRS